MRDSHQSERTSQLKKKPPKKPHTQCNAILSFITFRRKTNLQFEK